MLTCIISLQGTQVLNIFLTAKMNNTSENVLKMTHRIFTFTLGLSATLTVCYLKGGMCKPTALYYYLLQDLIQVSMSKPLLKESETCYDLLCISYWQKINLRTQHMYWQRWCQSDDIIDDNTHQELDSFKIKINYFTLLTGVTIRFSEKCFSDCHMTLELLQIPDVPTSSSNAVGVLIFIVVIVVFQILIEVKRFRMNKEEVRVNIVAVSALRQVSWRVDVQSRSFPPKTVRE